MTNEEEPGVVALNRTQPRVGVAVTASLSDPDGSVSGLTWQWSINGATATDSTPNGDIEDANSATYTPKAGDVGGTLTATAMYDDGQSADDAAKKTANADSAAVLRDTRNKPPAFWGRGSRYRRRAERHGCQEGGGEHEGACRR